MLMYTNLTGYTRGSVSKFSRA